MNGTGTPSATGSGVSPAAASGGGGVYTGTAPIVVTGTVISAPSIPAIVQGRVTLGAASSTITIPSLHGDTEGDYEFGGVLLWATFTGNPSVVLQPNADAGNAAGIVINPQTTTAFVASQTGLLVSAPNTTTAATKTAFRGRFRSKTAQGPRFFECVSFDIEQSKNTALWSTGWYTETATEITSLAFVSSGTLSFLIGSYVWWRSLGNTA